MDDHKKKEDVHYSIEKIKEGFKINSLTMGNAETGELIWKSDDTSQLANSTDEITAQIPKKLLDCRCVSRDVNFSSEELIKNLRLVQHVYFQDEITETLEFKFGFVIPGSTNNWQQTIDAVDPEDMIPAEVLSGNLVVVTQFFDDDKFICSSSVRIFYV